jgi:hypothetical protein
MECLLTIAFLCFADASEVQISPGGLTRFATVQSGSAEVTIPLYTDSLVTRDRWRMARACEEGTCVAYHKSCTTDRAGTICEYALAGRPYANALSIRAPDRAGVAQAESRIALVGEGPAQWQVPLSLLSVESSDDRPPSCRHQGRGRICFDAILARLAGLAAFEINGDGQQLPAVIAVAEEQGWRVESPSPAGPGPPPASSGWTVYASPSLQSLRFSPPDPRRPDDVRAFLIAIEPLLGLGMSVKALDAEGREIEP